MKIIKHCRNKLKKKPEHGGTSHVHGLAELILLKMTIVPKAS
jgi:hypothetical protein